MALVSHYNLPIYALEDWYNVCGEKFNIDDVADKIEEKEEGVYISTRTLEEVSPFHDKESKLPSDDLIKNFLNKLCEYNDPDIQRAYYAAYYGILKATTSINVLPNNSNHYVLYYLRVEVLIYSTLIELDRLSAASTIDLYKAIMKRDYQKISGFKPKCPATSLLSLLFIMDDVDSRDYNIFTDDGPTIEYKKLADLVFKKLGLIHMGNLSFKETEQDNHLPFRKLIFEDAVELQNQNIKLH